MSDFNVNDYVYVKLTDVGIEELERQHKELIEHHPNYTSPFIAPKTDDEGYSKFQLWDLMSRLGHLCKLGCRQPFETTIKLNKQAEDK